MKKYNFLGIIAVLFLFAACEKDETKAYLSSTPVGAVVQYPTANESIVLTVADSAEYVTFNWDLADFGYPAAATYLVQFDKQGGDFSAPMDVVTSVTNSASMMVYTLDNLLLSNGLIEDEANSLDMRVRAIIKGEGGSAFADTVFSEIVSFSITPFKIVINYPKLYVPGSYQGWSATDATTIISSVKSNNKYEGYLYFTEATTSFKLLKVPAWEEANTIGDPESSGTSGTLQIGSWGGNNINVSGGPGYFKINADLNEKTYSALKTDWGVIGSASAGGWDSDTNMTFDTTTKLWTLTTALSVGEIKFRANDGWDLNYGDTGADRKLDAGGDNIKVTEAGNYTITLDLTQPVYTYKLVKN